MAYRALSIFEIILLIFLVSCDKEGKKENQPERNKTTKTVNIEAEKLYNVYELLNNRDKEGIKELIVKDTQARSQGLYALASVGDTSDMYWVAGYLTDPNQATRQAAAYTLGILKNPNAESFLIQQYFNDSSRIVRKEIIEALGRCGTYKSIDFVAGLSVPIRESQTDILVSQAHALNDYARRGKFSKESRDRAEALLFTPESPDEVKRIISKYFTYPGVKTKDISRKITDLYLLSQNEQLSYNLILALKGAQSDETLKFLISQLDTVSSAQIKIAIANVLGNYDYEKVKKYFFGLLKDDNPQVAATSAKFFVRNGNEKDWKLYFDIVKGMGNWQARSLMLEAALKFSPEKEMISNSIISGYKASANAYEKASLLAALAQYPPMYEFIKDETFFSNAKIISTTGIKTLVRIRFSRNFDQYAEEEKEEHGVDIKKEYKLLLKEAMKRGDNAMIYYSANALADKKIKFIDQYENLSFINNALGRLLLPKDIKAYKAVCKLASKYMGTECSPSDSVKLTPINPDMFQGAYQYDKVIVKTSKGNFIISLNSNVPIAKAFWKQLIERSYFNSTYVCRTIPGKTIMFSSRRGDNWPDVNMAFVTELTPGHIKKGDVCLYKSDKSINTPMWFICTSDAQEMEGHVTKLGTIIQGYEVVKKLNVSDKVFSIEFYR